jgi:hypothetical protein
LLHKTNLPVQNLAWNKLLSRNYKPRKPETASTQNGCCMA